MQEGKTVCSDGDGGKRNGLKGLWGFGKLQKQLMEGKKILAQGDEANSIPSLQFGLGS